MSEDARREGGFLYRGQAREYRRSWPITDGPFGTLTESDLVDRRCWQFEPAAPEFPIQLRRGTLDLPSLIPTNTRAYERSLKGGISSWEENAFEDMMVYFWTTVCNFILALGCRVWQDKRGLAWLAAQWSTDFPALYKLRSVGQHYGMDTGLLDASSSVDVALWFATHHFESGAYRSNDSAVLYRIDRQGLQEVETWLRAIPEHAGKFDAASVDIGDTPVTLAPRAARQHGWSLVGWDHPRLVIRMAAEKLLVRYDFETGRSPSGANHLSREDLVPSIDPTGTLFRMFWQQQPRSLQDAQDWIDRYWNVATSSPIELDEKGEWLDQVSREIDRIYAFYVEPLRSTWMARG